MKKGYVVTVYDPEEAKNREYDGGLEQYSDFYVTASSEEHAKTIMENKGYKVMFVNTEEMYEKLLNLECEV